MKKLIYMALLFSVIFVIAACGNRQDNKNADGKTESSMSSTAQPDAEAEESKQPEAEAESNTESSTELSTEEQIEAQPTESAQQNTEQEIEEMKMKIQVGDTTFTATLADNSSVDALKELMADGPLTLNMSDYAGMEKGVDLGASLPQNNEQMNTQAGDIILYQGRTFAIYYDTNSWSLTPIGKIDNVSAKELREALGTGDVTVILSLEN